ncbi:MAG: hypothetical protein SGJ02_10080 [bacterium]|nr:hypothetical protein [bacterium]
MNSPITSNTPPSIDPNKATPASTDSRGELSRIEVEEGTELLGECINIPLEICPTARNLMEHLKEKYVLFSFNFPNFDLNLFYKACENAINTGYGEYERFSILISHTENAVAIIDGTSPATLRQDHKYIENDTSFGMMPCSIKPLHREIAECLNFEPNGGGHVRRDKGKYIVVGKTDHEATQYTEKYTLWSSSESYGKGDHEKAGKILAKLLAKAPTPKGIVEVQE